MRASLGLVSATHHFFHQIRRNASLLVGFIAFVYKRSVAVFSLSYFQFFNYGFGLWRRGAACRGSGLGVILAGGFPALRHRFVCFLVKEYVGGFSFTGRIFECGMFLSWRGIRFLDGVILVELLEIDLGGSDVCRQDKLFFLLFRATAGGAKKEPCEAGDQRRRIESCHKIV